MAWKFSARDGEMLLIVQKELCTMFAQWNQLEVVITYLSILFMNCISHEAHGDLQTYNKNTLRIFFLKVEKAQCNTGLETTQNKHLRPETNSPNWKNVLKQTCLPFIYEKD